MLAADNATAYTQLISCYIFAAAAAAYADIAILRALLR